VRVKTPRTITSFPHRNAVVIYNYLTKSAVTCSPAGVYWLTVAPEWKSVDQIADEHTHFDPRDVADQIQMFLDANVLLQEGTPQADQEEAYSKSWELGPTAALLHFATLDNRFESLSESKKGQERRALSDASPMLFLRNPTDAIVLPHPKHDDEHALIGIMSKRRTNRDVHEHPVSLQELSECLFSGLGITGFIDNGHSLLPLKMTPSGGCRNPYEAFVWARNISGLAPGFYHYSALEHNLAPLPNRKNVCANDLLGGQDWAEQMPAIIFLVAEIKRTTWKYNDPNAYRVVLIEAGHIAQNMMLACTQNGLTACPTAALAHSEISQLCNLDGISQTPIYALAIGRPKNYAEKIHPIEYANQRIF
jgi:SagB-type dehydrogenase family enzyme